MAKLTVKDSLVEITLETSSDSIPLQSSFLRDLGISVYAFFEKLGLDLLDWKLDNANNYNYTGDFVDGRQIKQHVILDGGDVQYSLKTKPDDHFRRPDFAFVADMREQFVALVHNLQITNGTIKRAQP